MVQKVILFLSLIYTVGASGKVHFYCHQNSSALYLNNGTNEYVVEDFKFTSDASNPAWVNCNVFARKIYNLKNKKFRYKKLMDGENVRILSSQFLKTCLNYRYCELNISSLLARPRYIWTHFKKLYLNKSPPERVSPFVFSNEMIELPNDKISFSYLNSTISPVGLAQVETSALTHIVTMNFDTDAMDFFIQWGKDNPLKKLHVYFAGHLQFLTNRIDLSVLKDYPNILLHPVFLSKEFSASFHMKGILTDKNVYFYTLNFKKSSQSLNDLALKINSVDILNKYKNLLMDVDQVNCFNLKQVKSFTESFLEYQFIIERYEQYCQSLVKRKFLKTSLFSLQDIRDKEELELFTHILHPAMIDMFPTAKFYVNRLSKNQTSSKVKYHKNNHYKFIKSKNCLYFMSSNLTPTAGSNRGEITFKSCSGKLQNQFTPYLNEIREKYKSQDELEILSQ